MIRKYFVIGLLVVYLLSCKEEIKINIPSDILAQNQMVEVLTDVQILEAAISKRLISGDNMQQEALKEYARLFDKHGISREQFEKSYTFYSGYPHLMEGIFDEVIKELSKKDAELKNVNRKGP